MLSVLREKREWLAKSRYVVILFVCCLAPTTVDIIKLYSFSLLDHKLTLGFSLLSTSQILCLLDVMGLRQYRDHFKVEQVNGEILSECDDDMLTHDLHITSKLHRKRLIKLISGGL